MPIRFLVFVLVAAAFTLRGASADQGPTVSGPPNASEIVFVRAIQADLDKRFPTPADAEKAGYFRYTNADDTGAISYANLAWTSTDIRHPSQLWYDKNGKLLGADFSVSSDGAPRPQLFGVQPGRWVEFDEHVHYVEKDPKTGKLLFDKYVLVPKFDAAGGDAKHPTAQTLVKLGRVASASDVAKVFYFPSIWDLIVWVKTNPKGAFADKNPLVTP
jgi:hypothetical protein